MNCERCEERFDRIREGSQREPFDATICDDCYDSACEAAYERSLSDYYGGGGPVTIHEQCSAADSQRRELRRRD